VSWAAGGAPRGLLYPLDKDIAISKKERLAERLKSLDGLLVAFSGGVDSTFLLAVAREVLGARIVAATAASPVHPAGEGKQAAGFCIDRDIEHIRFASDEMSSPEFLANPPHRCYVCKQGMIRKLVAIAGERGIACVAHGANLDDMADYRPGFRAAVEAGLLAPLVDAGLRKDEVRFLAKEMGLSVWDKPAMACLATRIPYGSVITREKLHAVEAAERMLLDHGFSQVRVRHHGSVARLEVPPEDLDRIMKASIRQFVVEGLRCLGFDHVALDLEGYQPGKMNRELEQAARRGHDQENPS